jgi:hypothetical protein
MYSSIRRVGDEHGGVESSDELVELRFFVL